MKKAAVIALAALASEASAGAPTIELISSDLTSGAADLDNIKATWTQSLKLPFLDDVDVSVEYDRSDGAGIKDATLSGTYEKINYEVTGLIDGNYEITLEADADGTTFEAVADKDNGLTKVTASKSMAFGARDCDVEVAYDVASKASKLSLSTVLGKGVSGTVNVADGSTDYELEYETSLSAGRTLSATVNPADGSGEIEYEDESTLDDATITATVPLGGSPSVTVKRSWSF